MLLGVLCNILVKISTLSEFNIYFNYIILFENQETKFKFVVLKI